MKRQKTYSNHKTTSLVDEAKTLFSEDPQKALRILKKAFKKDQGNVSVLDTMTVLYLAINEPLKAEKTARRRIGLQKSPAAYGLFAKTLYENKKLDKAEHIARKGVVISNNSSDFVLLAKILFKRGDLEEAEHIVFQALDLRLNIESCDIAIKVLLAVKKYDEAEIIANKIIKDTDGKEGQRFLWAIYLAKGDLAKAEEIAKHAIKTVDSDSHYYLLAEVYRKKREYVKAIDFIDKIEFPDFRHLTTKAYCQMNISLYLDSFNCLQDAEGKFIAKNVTGDFDLGIKIYNGYLFLFSRREQIEGLREKAEISYDYLIKLKNIGSFQLYDVMNALKIGHEYFGQ